MIVANVSDVPDIGTTDPLFASPCGGPLEPDPAVIAKLEERRAARAAKDFARSDKIRDELLAMGYAIKDVAGGKVEVRRAGS